MKNDIFAYGLKPKIWRRTMEDLNKNKTRPSKKEIEICKQWIKQFAQPKKATKNGRAYSSYFLKHRVEAANGMACYVSNGSFIAAAIDLGFEWVRDDPASINVYFFMKLDRKVLEPTNLYKAAQTIP